MASPPLHPGLTHWPFAFLTLSWALDIATYFSSSLPPRFLAFFPVHTPAGQQLGQSLLALGVFSSIPAVLTGATQAVSAVEKSGLFDESGAVRAKFKIVAAHALLSDVIVGIAGWDLYRRSYGKGGVDELRQVAMAAGLSVALVLAAHLGGRLTYLHGMGMSIGKGKKKAA